MNSATSRTTQGVLAAAASQTGAVLIAEVPAVLPRAAGLDSWAAGTAVRLRVAHLRAETTVVVGPLSAASHLAVAVLLEAGTVPQSEAEARVTVVVASAADPERAPQRAVAVEDLVITHLAHLRALRGLFHLLPVAPTPPTGPAKIVA